MSVLYRTLWRAHVLYCRLLRPVTLGVRAMVFDPDGRLLLVKHTYRDGWHMPGGAVSRRETALDCAKRELREEAGIVCPSEPELLPGLYFNTCDFKSDHVALFLVREWERDQSLKLSGEIFETGFFALDRLPDDTTPATRRRVREYLDGKSGGFVW